MRCLFLRFLRQLRALSKQPRYQGFVRSSAIKMLQLWSEIAVHLEHDCSGPSKNFEPSKN